MDHAPAAVPQSDPEQPADEFLAILAAHPGFTAAGRAFARNMIAVVAADAALNDIFKDVGRYLVAMQSLYLHYTGGLTLPRLKAFGATSGYLSPGRARSLLHLLCYLGFLGEVPPDRPGEPVRYVPTGRFLTAWRNHLWAALDATRLIEPSVAYIRDRLDKPGIFGAFCRYHPEVGLRYGRESDQELAFVSVFLHRYAGVQILWELVAAEGIDALSPTETVTMSLAAAARRHGVSRIHVRRLLDAGAREGLLRYRAGGAVVLEEPAQAGIRLLNARQFGAFIAAAERTTAELPDDYRA